MMASIFSSSDFLVLYPNEIEISKGPAFSRVTKELIRWMIFYSAGPNQISVPVPKQFQRLNTLPALLSFINCKVVKIVRKSLVPGSGPRQLKANLTYYIFLYINSSVRREKAM